MRATKGGGTQQRQKGVNGHCDRDFGWDARETRETEVEYKCGMWRLPGDRKGGAWVTGRVDREES